MRIYINLFSFPFSTFFFFFFLLLLCVIFLHWHSLRHVHPCSNDLPPTFDSLSSGQIHFLLIIIIIIIIYCVTRNEVK
jgi:hypothetical protein